MVQKQPKALFKNWLLLVLCAALMPAFSFGQTTVTIGATSGTSHFVYGPCYRSSATSSFNYSKYAYLYTASELGVPAGSVITKVEWLKASGKISGGNNTFGVWMKNASSNTLTNNTTWDSLVSGASQVFSTSSQNFTADPDNWEAINLSSSFTYNGGSLEIMTNFVFAGTATAANNFYVNAATGKALGWATTTPIAGTMTLTASSYGDNRPTVRITYTAGSACTGSPTAGSAVSNANGTICSGTSVELNLTGNSVGNGMTYQWQESTNNSSWSPIGSASSVSATTISASTTKYYRAVVTCGVNSANSASVLVTVNPAFAGGTYTINSANPTSGSNFQSFTDFANHLNCSISGPVVVNVSGGPYNEQFKLGNVSGTSATNTITINGGGATISYVSISSADRGVVTLNGTDYVTINNLKINSVSSSVTDYGWGVFMTNDADNNTINNCTITLDTTTASSNYAGIVVSGSGLSATATGSNCDNETISNNTINGGYYGISLVGNTSSTTIGHTISGNTVKNFFLYGIYGGSLNNTSITTNNISRLTRTANINSFYGIWMYGGNTNIVIQKNRIHDPAAAASQSSFTFYGIGFNNSVSSGNLVYNNIFYNLQGNGDQIAMYNNASDVKWYFNSISSDFGASSGGNTKGFYLENPSSTGSTVTIKNNNISITRAGNTGTKVCIDIKDNSSSVIKGNNNYYGSTGVKVGGLSGTYYSSLSAWQSATTDNNSIAANPVFVSASGGNLKPTASALNNAGVFITGINSDFNGDSRNNPPDIGAYEFSTAAACSGAVSTGLLSGPASACTGVSFGMALTGFPTNPGVTFKWQVSTDGGSTYATISGATLPTYTATQTVSSKYRVIAKCTNTGDSSLSNVITVTMSANSLCYCASYAVGSDGGDITAVTFGNLSNTSTCTTTGGSGSMQNLYSNYTSNVSPAVLTIGSKVPFTVTVGNCSNPANGYLKTYIDYNNDGDFADAGEEVFVSDAFVTTNGTSVSGIVTVPTGLTAGNTRMRVVMVETNNANDVSYCGTYTYGETEDYLVSLTANSGTQPTLTITKASDKALTVRVLNGTGSSVAGTFVVISETDPLQYDPKNLTSYNAPSNSTSVSFNDTTLVALANGKVINNITGKKGLPFNIAISNLRSGLKYYIYAYTYTVSGGNIYNSAVSIDSTTTVIAPTVKAKTLAATTINTNSALLTWQNGNGAGRIVVMSETSLSALGSPVTDASYSGNASFGSGDSISTTSNFVVATISDYNPSANDTLYVTNLKAGKKYQFAIYEFNGEQGSTPLKYSGVSPKVAFQTLKDYVSIATNAIGLATTEDFSSMTGTDLPTGWHASSAMSVDNGSSSSQGIKNYGATSGSNRSLGSLGSSLFGVKIVNGSSVSKPATWTSILIRYTGKQFRNGDGSNDNLTVQYSTDAYTFNGTNQYLSNTAATWTNASSNLTFTAPTSTPNNSALDGSLTSNQTFRFASIVANIPAQSYIWIRWVNSAGSLDGLSIDDISIIPFSNTATTGSSVAGVQLSGLNVVGNASASANITTSKIFNIEQGASLDLTSGPNRLTVNNKWYGTGYVKANSDNELVIDGSNDNQTVYCDPSFNTFKNLKMMPDAMVTLGNAMNISNSITFTSNGTINTNGFLGLLATSTSTAYIDQVKNGSTINGDVTVHFVTNSPSGIRLIGHPFSTAIPISQLNDDMTLDLSGQSGQNIWYYNTQTSATGANTTTQLTLNSKWTGFSYLTDTWSVGTGIRLSANSGGVNFGITGHVNQGDVTITQSSGNSGVTIIGNPYPSPVKLDQSIVPSNITSIYYWNPNANSGTGNWVTKAANKIPNTIVPMCGAFVAVGPANTTFNWSFTEAKKSKTVGSVTSFFRDADQNDNSVGLTLNINKGNDYSDELSVYFDKTASSINDGNNDAIKMINPGVDFYTKSADDVSLAVDSRQFIDGSIIPLGITKATPGKYSISVAEWTVSPSSQVYLVDNYTNKTVELNSNSIYSFNIDNNEASQGEKRFHLHLGKLTTHAIENTFAVNLAPNPATDFINISINGSNDGKAQVKVLSVAGAVIMNSEIESVAHSQLTLPVNQLTPGVYFVEVNFDGIKSTKQFVKQ